MAGVKGTVRVKGGPRLFAEALERALDQRAAGVVLLQPANGGPEDAVLVTRTVCSSGPQRQLHPSAGLADVVRALEGGEVSPLPEQPSRSAADELTSREREVLVLLGKGASNAAIGEALGISPNTARTHVARVIAKLGAESRLEAGAIARDGTVTP